MFAWLLSTSIDCARVVRGRSSMLKTETPDAIRGSRDSLCCLAWYMPISTEPAAGKPEGRLMDRITLAEARIEDAGLMEAPACR